MTIFHTLEMPLARPLIAAAGLVALLATGAWPQRAEAERAARTAYQYWVQVGAHKDEAVGRAEWQRIQTAAGDAATAIGNRIQRADLGARGIYYRLQFGPFGSMGEAGQFCAQLKARQLDCFMAPPEAAMASTRPPEAPVRKAAPPAPRPAAKPADPNPVAKPAEPQPIAKPAEAKPVPAERPAAALPKRPDAETPPLPEPRPRNDASAEKPDAPLSTAPGLPGVLD